MQFSGAQSLVPISKEGILIPGEEPQVQGVEPKPQKEYAPGVNVNEDKPERKSKEQSKEQSTFTCTSDSVDRPTKADCIITAGDVSTSYQCNADAITNVWSCVEETATANTDKSTLSSTMTAAKRETLKQIIQNLRG